MSHNKNLWHGREMPTVIPNRKEWTLAVEDEAVNILTDAFLKLAKATYGYRYSLHKETAQKTAEASAELLKEQFMNTAIQAGLPLWFPETENDEF